MGNLCRGNRNKANDDKIKFIKQIIQNDHQFQNQSNEGDYIVTETNSQADSQQLEERKKMQEKIQRLINNNKDIHEIINRTLNSRLIKKCQLYNKNNNTSRRLSTFKMIPLLYLDRIGMKTEIINKIFHQFQSYSICSQSEYLINLYRITKQQDNEQSSWFASLFQNNSQRLLQEQQFETGVILLSNEAIYFLQQVNSNFYVKKRVLYQSIKKITQIALEDNSCVISLVSKKLNYTGDIILQDQLHYNFYIWFKTSSHQADSLINESKHIAHNFYNFSLDIDYLKGVKDFSQHIIELVDSFDSKNTLKASILSEIRTQFFKLVHHKSARHDDLAQIFKVQQILAEKKDHAYNYAQKFFTTQYLIIDAQHIYVTNYKKEKLKIVSKIEILSMRKLKINDFHNFMGFYIDQEKNYNLAEYFKQYTFYSKNCSQICLLIVNLFSENNKQQNMLKINEVSTYNSRLQLNDDMIKTDLMNIVQNKFKDSKQINPKNTTQNLQDLSSFLKDYLINKDESIDQSFGSINNFKNDTENILQSNQDDDFLSNPLLKKKNSMKEKDNKILVTNKSNYHSQFQ